MCGITGFVSNNKIDEIIIKRMSNMISSRGPDKLGFWSDNASGIAFGHRRLSILDLSQAGNQPMHSLNNRYTIIFNGEIYNHLKLRKLLLKKVFIMER